MSAIQYFCLFCLLLIVRSCTRGTVSKDTCNQNILLLFLHSFCVVYIHIMKYTLYCHGFTLMNV